MQRHTVFITGASSGIGQATAFYFQRHNWNVEATMRNLNKQHDLVGLENVSCSYLDVTKPESIRAAVEDTLSRFGSIDVVVNNAGTGFMGPFECATPERISSFFDVNLFGVMNVTREIIPYFREKRSGTIINVASLAGRIGIPFSSLYGSSKWAVEGFSEALMYELERFGIRMKIIEPGAIRTNFAANAIILKDESIPEYRDGIRRREEAYAKREPGLSDPAVVAKTIYRAATDTSGRLRYLTGNGAKPFSMLRRILPFSLFSALVRKMAG